MTARVVDRNKLGDLPKIGQGGQGHSLFRH
jgi:hypothetical protein